MCPRTLACVCAGEQQVISALADILNTTCVPCRNVERVLRTGVSQQDATIYVRGARRPPSTGREGASVWCWRARSGRSGDPQCNSALSAGGEGGGAEGESGRARRCLHDCSWVHGVMQGAGAYEGLGLSCGAQPCDNPLPHPRTPQDRHTQRFVHTKMHARVSPSGHGRGACTRLPACPHRRPRPCPPPPTLHTSSRTRPRPRNHPRPPPISTSAPLPPPQKNSQYRAWSIVRFRPRGLAGARLDAEEDASDVEGWR